MCIRDSSCAAPKSSSTRRSSTKDNAYMHLLPWPSSVQHSRDDFPGGGCPLRASDVDETPPCVAALGDATRAT
eukprot:7271608-Pyramimonas_sp.AAC.1